MLTSNAEELRLFLKCTVIGRGVFGPCACCLFDAEEIRNLTRLFLFIERDFFSAVVFDVTRATLVFTTRVRNLPKKN